MKSIFKPILLLTVMYWGAFVSAQKGTSEEKKETVQEIVGVLNITTGQKAKKQDANIFLKLLLPRKFKIFLKIILQSNRSLKAMAKELQ